MAEQLDTKILPLLPLTTGVVLPGMVVTLTLESPEAAAAVKAARFAGDDLLLVPRSEDGHYARVGTVAHIEERSEEHTSELQSRENLVCRLLLEKKKHS